MERRDFNEEDIKNINKWRLECGKRQTEYDV